MKPDDQIRKDVINEIKLDAHLTMIAPQLGVSVRNEVVTLSGIVDYYGQKLAAEKAAKRVSDVKVVALDIEVRTAGTDAISDTTIAGAVRDALSWHSAVNDDLVNIKVEEGWIFLEGVVNWEYERRPAASAVENLHGVKGVVNNIKIRDKEIEPTEVRKKIKTAFHRHAQVDAANIQVSASDGSVKLSGTVRSWTERKDAEDVVWSLPGVTQVENNLEIEHEVYAGE